MDYSFHLEAFELETQILDEMSTSGDDEQTLQLVEFIVDSMRPGFSLFRKDLNNSMMRGGDKWFERNSDLHVRNYVNRNTNWQVTFSKGHYHHRGGYLEIRVAKWPSYSDIEPTLLPDDNKRTILLPFTAVYSRLLTYLTSKLSD